MIAPYWAIPQRIGSSRSSSKSKVHRPRFGGAVALGGQRSRLMPALFAYLIALCLLFGAGYGALNWLAEPPVKVAAKAKWKSKSQPSYQQAPSSYQAPSQEIAEASPPASKSDQSSVMPTANDHDAASTSKDQKIPSQAQPSLATDDPAMQPAIASPAAGNEIRSANAELPSDDG